MKFKRYRTRSVNNRLTFSVKRIRYSDYQKIKIDYFSQLPKQLFI